MRTISQTLFVSLKAVGGLSPRSVSNCSFCFLAYFLCHDCTAGADMFARDAAKLSIRWSATPSRSSITHPVCTENLNASVLVMKSAKDAA
jgi:hypothetical protein